jgi:LPS export ABC transporter protein LptC
VKGKPYGIIFLLLILGVSAGIYWKGSFNNKSPIVADSQIVEESMQGVRALRFDNQGHLNQEIHMQQWLRYQDTTVTQMIQPSLRVHATDGSLWDISAQNGEGFQEDMGKPLEKIHLFNNVIVKRTAKKADRWLTLTTTSLLFFPQEAMALTDDPVMIVGPNLQMKAQGLRADLDRHSIEFLKRVNSVYVPT